MPIVYISQLGVTRASKMTNHKQIHQWYSTCFETALPWINNPFYSVTIHPLIANLAVQMYSNNVKIALCLQRFAVYYLYSLLHNILILYCSCLLSEWLSWQLEREKFLGFWITVMVLVELVAFIYQVIWVNSSSEIQSTINESYSYSVGYINQKGLVQVLLLGLVIFLPICFQQTSDPKVL